MTQTTDKSDKALDCIDAQTTRELLPCPSPWCEAEERDGDFLPAIRLHHFGTYRVVCTSCILEGPLRHCPDAAIAAWNDRPSPTPQQGVEAAVERMREALEYASLKLSGEPRFGDVKRKVDAALSTDTQQPRDDASDGLADKLTQEACWLFGAFARGAGFKGEDYEHALSAFRTSFAEIPTLAALSQHKPSDAGEWARSPKIALMEALNAVPALLREAGYTRAAATVDSYGGSEVGIYKADADAGGANEGKRWVPDDSILGELGHEGRWVEDDGP